MKIRLASLGLLTVVAALSGAVVPASASLAHMSGRCPQGFFLDSAYFVVIRHENVRCNTAMRLTRRHLRGVKRPSGYVCVPSKIIQRTTCHKGKRRFTFQNE